jgi:flagellar biosynthesis/type III secretory pathway M-ring protein FliF/YscJ
MNPEDTNIPAMPMASKPAPPLPRQLPGRAPQLTPNRGASNAVAAHALQNDVTLALDGVEGRIAQNLMHRTSALVDTEPDRALAVLRRWLHEPS